MKTPSLEAQGPRKKSINVFCGARIPRKSQLQNDVDELARICVAKNYRLVYGGGDRGVMGWLQKSWQREQGESLGVLPDFLRHRERINLKGCNVTDLSGCHVTGLEGRQLADVEKIPSGEVRLVSSLSVRKQIMADESDLFLILPGGLGTLDEFSEVITWRQLGLHEKPIYLYNCDGFFTPLLDWLQRAKEWGFVDDESLAHFQTIQSISELTAIL